MPKLNTFAGLVALVAAFSAIHSILGREDSSGEPSASYAFIRVDCTLEGTLKEFGPQQQKWLDALTNLVPDTTSAEIAWMTNAGRSVHDKPATRVVTKLNFYATGSGAQNGGPLRAWQRASGKLSETASMDAMAGAVGMPVLAWSVDPPPPLDTPGDVGAGQEGGGAGNDVEESDMPADAVVITGGVVTQRPRGEAADAKSSTATSPATTPASTTPKVSSPSVTIPVTAVSSLEGGDSNKTVTLLIGIGATLMGVSLLVLVVLLVVRWWRRRHRHTLGMIYWSETGDVAYGYSQPPKRGGSNKGATGRAAAGKGAAGSSAGGTPKSAMIWNPAWQQVQPTSPQSPAWNTGGAFMGPSGLMVMEPLEVEDLMWSLEDAARTPAGNAPPALPVDDAITTPYPGSGSSGVPVSTRVPSQTGMPGGLAYAALGSGSTGRGSGSGAPSPYVPRGAGSNPGVARNMASFDAVHGGAYRGSGNGASGSGAQYGGGEQYNAFVNPLAASSRTSSGTIDL